MGNERAFGRLCVAPLLRKLPFREVAFNDSLLRSGPPPHDPASPPRSAHGCCANNTSAKGML